MAKSKIAADKNYNRVKRDFLPLVAGTIHRTMPTARLESTVPALDGR